MRSLNLIPSEIFPNYPISRMCASPIKGSPLCQSPRAGAPQDGVRHVCVPNGLPDEAVRIFKGANPAFSPAAWGLKWVWDHGKATVILSGMNDPKQVDGNISLADTCPPLCITEAERETFKHVLALFNKSYKIHCTGCNYCMPARRQYSRVLPSVQHPLHHGLLRRYAAIPRQYRGDIEKTRESQPLYQVRHVREALPPASSRCKQLADGEKEYGAALV